MKAKVEPKLLTEAEAMAAEAFVDAKKGKLGDYTEALNDTMAAAREVKTAMADWRAADAKAAVESSQAAKEQDLIAAFKVFDTDNSGKLSFDELKAILQRDAPGNTPMSEHEIASLIESFDGSVEGSEKDGMLDVAEFVKALSEDPDVEDAINTNDKILSARYERAFEKYDKDQSGGLSVAELRPALIASGESANEARGLVKDFDADGDGELSKDELARAWDGLKPIQVKDR
jgi:Ca2+-binding EF-hand superfamily protein